MNHSHPLRASFRSFVVVLGLLATACNFGHSTPLSDADASFEAGSVEFDASAPSAEAGRDSAGPPHGDAEAGPADVTIGGYATGLVGTGLVLRDNGADDLAVAGNGAFTFKTHVAAGAPYAVTVSAQPVHPTQVCTVTAGTGNATAAVTDVQVTCTTKAYPVGGTLVGLSTTSTGGVVLADTLSGGVTDTVTVNQNGSFTFPTEVASGSAFAVSVKTNPSSPAQTCNVSGGTGILVAGGVTSVVVNCATNTYVLGGSVSGLDGQGLVLQNGSSTVAVSSNGTFAFPAALPSGTSFAVTVQTQPTGPSQTCSVSAGTGTVGAGDVSTVSVACVTDTFPVGGTVSGLLGAGLALQSGAGDTLPVAADGTFVFPTAVASGAPYSVVALTQPTLPWQTCAVTGGAGTVGDGPVTTVQVTCVSNRYPVQVTASGVAGKGLTLTLDSADPLTVAADGNYTFGSSVESGATYSVAVSAQPTNPTQTCAVTGGTGTVGGGPVDSVMVACTTQAYPLGGTVSGLVGTGLVLTNDGGDKIAVPAGATTVAFTTPVASGGSYDVEIATQPSGPSQTCTVSGNNGTVISGAVNSVVINCGIDTFTVGGTVSGLAGKGLVLQSGTATVAVTAQGSFAFPPIASGSAYAVTVATQPATPSQLCSVTGGTGTVGGANVTTVQVACVTQPFTVGGVVTTLSGSGLVLQDDGADDLPVAASGPFTFKTPVLSGAAYAVTVKSQPTSPWQTCTPQTASGTVGGANVVGVQIGCATNQYQVSASVTGLTGAGLTLTLNGGNPTAIAASGTIALGAKMNSGSSYTVAVQSQPTNPSQTCSVTAAGTTLAGSDVTVAVTCTTNAYSVGGTVAGLNGSGLVLTDTGNGDTVTVAAGATSFAFPKSVASGQTYFVTASTQPSNPTQSCNVTGGSGKVGGGPVTTVTVNCQTQTYTIGGSITVAGGGSLGSGLALTNGAEVIHPTSTGSFAFTTPVASGAGYAVTVTGQPAGPTQSCVATSASGTVVSGNVNNVVVTCTTQAFKVGGTVSGLAPNTSVVLVDNGVDALTVSANGSFAYGTAIPSGGGYSAAVKTQPTNPWQTCVASSNAGTVGGGPVTGIVVKCTTNTVTVSGTVSGLGANGLTLTLSGSGLLASETVGVAANATNFAFTSQVPSGSTYTVKAVGKPQSPSETCVVGASTGTIQNTAVTSVAVTCTVDSFTVGGSISGLTGAGMVLTDNGTDVLTPAAGATTFAFQAQVKSGQPYAVAVKTQPAGQSCSVSGGNSGGSGTVGNGPVSLTVNCSTLYYTVSGQISGLTGGGLQLTDGKDTITVGNGATSFAFPTPLASGSSYTLGVAAQPTSYWDSCSISPTGTQTIAANVSNVVVTCTPRTGSLVVSEVGGGGAGVVVTDGRGDSLPIPVNVDGNGKGTFSIPSGGTFNLGLSQFPTGKTCTLSGTTSGTMGDPGTPLAATVSCTTITFPLTITVYNGQCQGGFCSSQCGTLPLNLTGTVSSTLDASGASTSTGGSYTFTVPYGSGETVAYPGGGGGNCTCSTSSVNIHLECSGNTEWGCPLTVINDPNVTGPQSATIYCLYPIG